MACGCTSELEFLKLEKAFSNTSITEEEGEKTSEKIKKIKLKKGGWVVETKIGNIQFGMVPDTVKDSIC